MLPAGSSGSESLPVQVKLYLQGVRQHLGVGEQGVYGVKLARDAGASIIHEEIVYRTEVTVQTVQTQVTYQTGRRRSDGV